MISFQFDFRQYSEIKIWSAILHGFISLFSINSFHRTLSENFHFSINDCLQYSKSEFQLQNLIKIFPLPIFYVWDILLGLGGTMELSLSMFTVLRRMLNVFPQFTEMYFLNYDHTLHFPKSVRDYIKGNNYHKNFYKR